MEKYKYHYKTSFLKGQLFSGILYIVIGLSSFFFPSIIFLKFLIVLGFLYFFQYFRWSKFGYISIDEKYIRRNHLLTKRISISELKGLKYYVGTLTLITEKKTLNINKEFLPEKDFESLEKHIKSIIKKNKSTLQSA